MRLYPKATFILTTTILEHNENWDSSIEEVCRRVNSPRVHHFLYSNNGKGTPVLVHGFCRKHTLEIRLISGDASMLSSFDLVSVIASSKDNG